jgi:threonine synthase
MQLIGQLFQAALKRSGERVTIVGATSGDTGSAAIEAFRGLDNVDVFILFPHGRVSEVQRRQMTTPADANVHALAVDGDFDTCQALVKDMFNDFAFRDRVRLAGVNSINWARVLAQVVYYFTAAVALGAPHRPSAFTVPTGNFGDIFAGHIARAMGLPIERLVIATNQNDILHRCLTTGDYRTEGCCRRSARRWTSRSRRISSARCSTPMAATGRGGAADGRAEGDRALHRQPGRAGRRCASLRLGPRERGRDRATIARTARRASLLCPHSAVGVAVAEAHLGPVPMVTLATAHPAKFPDAVEAATGIRPACRRAWPTCSSAPSA